MLRWHPPSLWEPVILIVFLWEHFSWVLISGTAEVDIARTRYLMWEASLSKAVVFIKHSSGTCCSELACQHPPINTPTHKHTCSLPKFPLHLATFRPNDGHYHFSVTCAGLGGAVLWNLKYANKHCKPSIISFKKKETVAKGIFIAVSWYLMWLFYSFKCK